MNSPKRPSDPKRQRDSRSEQEHAAEQGEDLFRDTVVPGGATDPDDAEDLFRDSLPHSPPTSREQVHNPSEEVDLFRDSLPPPSALQAEEDEELWKDSIAPQHASSDARDEQPDLWKESVAPKQSSVSEPEDEDLFKDSIPPGSKVFPKSDDEAAELWTDSLPPQRSAADATEDLFKDSMPPQSTPATTTDNLFKESLPPQVQPEESGEKELSEELFKDSLLPQSRTAHPSEEELSEDLFKESIPPKVSPSDEGDELFRESLPPSKSEDSASSKEPWADSQPPGSSASAVDVNSDTAISHSEGSDSNRNALDMSGLFEPDTGDEPGPLQKRPYSNEEPSEEPSSLWKQSVPSLADPNLGMEVQKTGRRVPVDVAAGNEPGLDQKISGLWGTIAGPGTHERQSLGYRGPTKSKPEPSLVVKIRSLDKPRTEENPGEPPDFEIHKKLGEGGMGMVYLARQSCVDRFLAVKMLKPDQAADPSTRERFLAEAAVTGDLDHPNIVPIHEVARTEKDSLFYAMKRVVGQPWEEVISEKEIGENLEIWMRMADAVAFAHDKGVIHRDLKPENVMLGDYGEVLLMDWGLATNITGRGKGAQANPQESAGGTPAYLPPETARGYPEQFKITSDIYLLGAILYEIITGYPPHTGATVIDCLMAAARNEIRKTDEKDELVDIALIAMATKVKDRFQNVREMQEAVRAYLDHRESVVLSKRAQQHLKNALDSKKYDDFSQAIFGYREALSMWRHNDGARYGLAEATLAYAEAAYEKDDFDLAISLLDRDNEEHRGLIFRAEQAQQERINRQAQLKIAQFAMAGLAVVIMIGLTIGTLWINSLRSQAEVQRDQALASKTEAEAARQEAEAEQQAAIEAQQESEGQRQRAEKERIAAEKARLAAEKSQNLAKEQQRRAVKAESEAKQAREDAQQQLKRAEVAKVETSKQAYYAQIGLADAQIQFNAYARSAQLIAASNPPQRHWEWGYLNFLCNQHRQIYVGHEQAIEDLAVSPDGSLVATVGQDGFGLIFDRETGEQLAKLNFPERPIGLSVAFSPDGTVLAVGTATGKVLLWETKHWQLQHTIKAHIKEDGEPFPIAALAFSPVQNWLVTGSSENYSAIRFWDYRTGERFSARDITRAVEGQIQSLQFSNDGQQLLAAGKDGLVVVWSNLQPQRVQQGRLKGIVALSIAPDGNPPIIQAHRNAVYAAIFTPNGKQVITAGESGTIKVWNLNAATGVPTIAQTYTGHNGRINSLAISPDGHYLLSGGTDNSVIVWDLTTKQLVKHLRGHGGWVRCVAWVPNKDRTLLALSGSNDNDAKLWDVEAYQDSVRFQAPEQDPLLKAELAPIGTVCLTTSAQNKVHIWERDTGRRLTTLDESLQGQMLALKSTSEGRLLLATAEGNQAWIWDWQTREVLGRFDHSAPVVTADLSPDGQQFVVGTTEEIVYWKYLPKNETWTIASTNTIQLLPEEIIFSKGAKQWLLRFAPEQSQPCWIYYDNPTEDLLSFPNRQRPSSPIVGMDFLGDQNYVVTVFADGTLTIWDASTAKSIASVATRNGRAKTESLALSDDGKLALVGDSSGLVQAWQIKQQGNQFSLEKQPTSFPGPSGSEAVQSMAVASDGSEAAVVYQDRRIQFLDLKANKSLGSETLLQGTSQQVPTVRYLADGRLVTTTRDDALVWNLVAQGESEEAVPLHFQSEREIVPLSEFTGQILATFSADTSQVITVGSLNHVCHIWDLAKHKVVAAFRLETPAGLFLSLERSSDGKQLLLADNQGNATLWQLSARSAKLQQIFQCGSKVRLNEATFSPQEQWIAAAGEDGNGYLWAIDQPDEPIAVLPGHTQPLNSIDFAEDQSRLVTGGVAGEVRLWPFPDELPKGEIHELRPERTILAHPGSTVNTIIFSEDGQRVFTASNDQTTKVWDTSNGRELITLRGHSAAVSSVLLSKMQTTLVTVSRDGSARIWKATSWDNPQNPVNEAVAGRRSLQPVKIP